LRTPNLANTEEVTLTDTVVEALILDLLEWLAERDRSYDEAIGAWRTSCPRLPVWEDAVDRGLIVREDTNEKSTMTVTASGLALLERHGKALGHRNKLKLPLED
jgi:hypothetical protein